MLGVLLTLATVALLTVFLRDRFVKFTAQHGASLRTLTRILDALAGALLIAVSVGALWR
jgi:ABC-type nickel/cobalt efflux system permease component RcnA